MRAAFPGDMAHGFYDGVGPCGSADAAREAAALLGEGAVPDAALGLDHYREAVAWHRRGAIGDAELAAVALLVHLQRDEGAGLRATNLLQPAGRDERLPEAGLPPLLALLARHRIRRIKGMARDALIGWHRGTHPGVLAMGRVTDYELLQAQARGERFVGVGLPLDGFRATDEGYPGGFTHHDLCHLAKFRGPLGEAKVLAGQIAFFRAFLALVDAEPQLLARREEPGMDLTLVASDTNGDCRLLVTLFFARLLAQRGIAERAPAQRVVAEYLAKLGLPTEAARHYGVSRGAFLAEVAAALEGGQARQIM